MFETIFSVKSTVDQHRSGPFAEEREHFLRHCSAVGATDSTQRHRARVLLRVAQWMAPSDCEGIDVVRLRNIIDEMIPSPGSGWAANMLRTTRPWLRFLGWWREPDRAVAFPGELAEFVRWMRDERGLAPCTVEQWRDRTAKFLLWCAQTDRTPRSLKPEDIDAYFLTYGSDRWSRLSARHIASMLRVFLRHAATNGSCDARLADSIESPRRYCLDTLPYALDWADVRRLIATADTDSELDLRDRAILMLLAVYGLRRGEVAALRLRDIDFEGQRLQLWRLKRRQPQIYPLVPSAAAALRLYIDAARPSVTHAGVFIRAKAPRSPISPQAVYDMVSRRIRSLGLELAHRGPHAIRHACASKLLADGRTLKEIGDHLGHRSTRSTLIYTKVDLAALRRVGEFDLGSLQ